MTKKGYWSGSNLSGFTEFAEQFAFSKSCEISGISLGIAKAKLNPLYANSSIDIQVYEGTNKPEKLIYSENFSINKFYSDAMNYLQFASAVETKGNFFISYNVSKLNTGDTLVVYMANRKSDATNSFYLKNIDGWSTYNSHNLNGNGSALLVELLACNVSDTASVDTTKSGLIAARFYPNPVTGNSTLYVETVEAIDCPDEVTVYDMLGKKQKIPFTQLAPNKMGLTLTGLRPGIYFIHLESCGKSIVGKVAYLP